MIFQSKRTFLFLVLAAFFITNAIVAELISNKLIDVGPFTVIIGIIPWPIVFLSTDIINEFYGKSAVKRLSVLTSFMIAYAFIIVFIAMGIEANTTISDKTATDAEFNKVFGQSLWVIAGSITAFIVSQVLDVYVFWFIRKRTGGRFIWLRSTGSTVISQLIDSYIVMAIGFLLPGIFTFEEFLVIGLTNYSFKLIIAVGLTPFVYLSHWMVKRYLGNEAYELSTVAARESIEK